MAHFYKRTSQKIYTFYQHLHQKSRCSPLTKRACKESSSLIRSRINDRSASSTTPTVTQGWGNTNSIDASHRGGNGGVHVPMKGWVERKKFSYWSSSWFVQVHWTEVGVVATVVAFAIGLFIAVIPM